MDIDRPDDDIYPLSPQEEYSTEQETPLLTKIPGAQELQTLTTEVLETNASQQFLANHCITWKFIIGRASWWRGF